MSQKDAASDGATEMTKEELIWRVRTLYDQAVFAKTCDELAGQFLEYEDKYPMAIWESNSFYNVSHCAWTFSSSMTLAKLYDKNSKSETLNTLLTEIQKHKNQIPSQARFIIPYDSSPLSFWDCCQRFKYQMRILKPYIEKLGTQRDKSLAHNDKDLIAGLLTLFGKEGLNETEYTALLDFAINLTSFCLYVLTGQKMSRTGLDVGDWRNTIEIVEKNRDHSHDEELKIFGILP